MPVAEIDGIEIAYEVVGDGGRPWVLTPGGRFTKDVGGLPEMARALAEHGNQVVLWDRPNCGASSVVFGGPSESVVQAAALAALLRRLDLGPAVIAGGSGGSRVSLLTAARHPEVASGLAMWWISGGVPGLLQSGQLLLRTLLPTPHGSDGMQGGRPSSISGQEVLERRTRATGTGSSRWTAREFLDVMDRWMLAYCPCDDSLVPGLDADDIARLDVPILVFRSGESDFSHTRATSEALAAGLPGAELVEPPWGDEEWNERRAEIEQTGSLFVRWPLLVPQLLDWAGRTIGGDES